MRKRPWKRNRKSNFTKGWINTAKVDVQSARHKMLTWMSAAIVISIAYITSQFMPGNQAKIFHLVLAIPFVIMLIKMATSASALHDAKRFLRECRGESTNEVGNIQ